MNHDHAAALEWALDLWARWLRSDWSEVRELWYPSRTPGLNGGWARGEHAFDDMVDAADQKIVVLVNKVVGDMPPSMRAALEFDLNLLRVCRVRDQKEMAQEARARVWRAILSEGVI